MTFTTDYTALRGLICGSAFRFVSMVWLFT